MALGKFFLQFGREKVEEGVENIATFLAKVDPKTATDAQLAMIKDRRDEYARKLVDARKELERDLGETAAIQAQIDQATAALRVLKDQMGDASENKKRQIVKQAGVINNRIEELEVELAREQREDQQAQEVVDAVQRLYDQMDQMLKDAGSRLEEAERRMHQAEADKEHAQLMAELNGASESFGGLNVALDAMTAAAEASEREAETTRMTSASDASGDEGENLIESILAEKAKAEAPAVNDPFARVS